ncbi:MAG TPA: hypothetical protein VE130_03875 [Nitrososphaeraceae archaeon]|nr:hypothetical protein [Nitrososphaeraceae archaeon]
MHIKESVNLFALPNSCYNSMQPVFEVTAKSVYNNVIPTFRSDNIAGTLGHFEGNSKD